MTKTTDPILRPGTGPGPGPCPISARHYPPTAPEHAAALPDPTNMKEPPW